MPVIDNIITYYRFDSDANDLIGSENLTVTGASNVSGHISNCYSFDGNDSLDGVDTTVFDGLSNFSVNLWFFLTTSSGHQNLCSKLKNASNEDTFSLLYLNGHGFSLLVKDGSNNFINISNLTSYQNAWTMLTLVLNGTNLKLYINGTETLTGDNGSFTGGLKNSTAKFYIGRQDNDGDPRFINTGKIDEVGIWSKSLTPTEINTLYNSGNGLTYPFEDIEPQDPDQPGSKSGTKELLRRWPVVTGLELIDKHEGRLINLVPLGHLGLKTTIQEKDRDGI